MKNPGTTFMAGEDLGYVWKKYRTGKENFMAVSPYICSITGANIPPAAVCGVISAVVFMLNEWGLTGGIRDRTEHCLQYS